VSSRIYKWAERQQINTILDYRNTRSSISLGFHLFFTWVCSCEEVYRRVPTHLSLKNKALFYIKEMVTETRKAPTLSKSLQELSPIHMNNYILFLRDCVAQHKTEISAAP
jgi:hypothetical protein